MRRRLSGTHQLLPGDYFARVDDYYNKLRKMYTKHPYRRVIVADETFVLFEAAGSTTLEVRGTQKVAVTVQDEKGGVTAHLSA